jgi:hypothetical protein
MKQISERRVSNEFPARFNHIVYRIQSAAEKSRGYGRSKHAVFKYLLAKLLRIETLHILRKRRGGGLLNDSVRRMEIG